MAKVNRHVTEAVSQTNATVIGSSPAHAIAALYQLSGHAVSLSMHNAVSNQQNMNELATAIATSCVRTLLQGEE